jgi:hypothetical protein
MSKKNQTIFYEGEKTYFGKLEKSLFYVYLEYFNIGKWIISLLRL